MAVHGSILPEKEGVPPFRVPSNTYIAQAGAKDTFGTWFALVSNASLIEKFTNENIQETFSIFLGAPKKSSMNVRHSLLFHVPTETAPNRSITLSPADIDPKNDCKMGVFLMREADNTLVRDDVITNAIISRSSVSLITFKQVVNEIAKKYKGKINVILLTACAGLDTVAVTTATTRNFETVYKNFSKETHFSVDPSTIRNAPVYVHPLGVTRKPEPAVALKMSNGDGDSEEGRPLFTPHLTQGGFPRSKMTLHGASAGALIGHMDPHAEALRHTYNVRGLKAPPPGLLERAAVAVAGTGILPGVTPFGLTSEGGGALGPSIARTGPSRYDLILGASSSAEGGSIPSNTDPHGHGTVEVLPYEPRVSLRMGAGAGAAGGAASSAAEAPAPRSSVGVGPRTGGPTLSGMRMEEGGYRRERRTRRRRRR
jgi:hypothetical protein